MFKELCLCNSASGDEEEVRDYIIENIQNYCEYKIDKLGSIIAYKQGKRKPSNTVMLCAHMDEVGFIITEATDEGYLKFAPVGGIDPKVVVDRVVTIGDIEGVIGIKPVHLLSEDEKSKAPSFKELLIDIGTKNKDDALNFIHPGDYAYFKSDFEEFGEKCVKSKALDDRIGCMLLIELIKADLDFDTYFCFNVQEEVGLRGALCTSFDVKPDVSVIVEATTAGDLCGVTGGDRICTLGGGAVVSYMDKRTIYDKYLYHLALDTAKMNNIKAQTKTAIAGGNDAGAIQTSHGGSRVIAISVPCRYIHSGASVANRDDISETRKLLRALLPRLYD